VNQTKSERINVFFEKGELNKVVFLRDLKGTLYPISQKKPAEMQLSGFRWEVSRRPKTKYEMYE
jgi:hypothetical protein